MVFGGTSFFLYPYFIIQSTSRSYWLPVVAWFLLGLAGAWIFTRMLAKKPGSDAYAVSKQEFGRIGILLFHLPLMAFAWNTIVLMIRAHAEIISMTMLHATPQWFLNAFLFVSLFLASGGFKSIVRTAGVFTIVSVPLSIGLTIVGLSDIQPGLGRPWLRCNRDFLHSPTFYAASYMWAGFVYFAVCGKYTKKPGQLWKAYAAAAAIFLPLIFSAVYLPILTFGPELSKSLTFPYISKMDSISKYGLVFENLTAIFISVSILYVILTVAMMINCLGVGVQALFPKWQRKWVYVCIGILTYGTALVIPSWHWIERAVVWDTPLRLYVMFIFPLAVLLKSRIREGKSRES